METDIRKQFYAADRIKKVKLKEWYQKAKPHVISYILDYLFHRQGEVAQMVKFDETVGFLYDPVTLEQGVDTLIRVLESARNGDDKKAQNIYSAFENPVTRINYLWRIVDSFDMYKAVGEVVCADLDEYAKTVTDPEILDTIDARKRNIKSRAEMERKTSTPTGWQP